MKRIIKFSIILVTLSVCLLMSSCDKEDIEPIYIKPVPPINLGNFYGSWYSYNTNVNGFDATKSLRVSFKISVDSTIDKYNRPTAYFNVGRFITTETSAFNVTKIDTIIAQVELTSGILVGGQPYKAIRIGNPYCYDTNCSSNGDSGTSCTTICDFIVKGEFIYEINNDGSLILTRYIDKVKYVYALKK